MVFVIKKILNRSNELEKTIIFLPTFQKILKKRSFFTERTIFSNKILNDFTQRSFREKTNEIDGKSIMRTNDIFF